MPGSSCPIFKPVLCFLSDKVFLFIIGEERSHDREEDSDGTYHESKFWQDGDCPYGSWGHSGADCRVDQYPTDD